VPDLTQPVAEVLLSPPLGFLHPHLQPEVLTGSGTLPRLSHVPVSLQYGCIFTAFTIPPGLGHTTSLRPTYRFPLMELWFVAELGTTASVRAAKFEMTEPEMSVRFFSLELSSLEYSVLPGVEVAWSYLTLS
jgi:hypothetical protein